MTFFSRGTPILERDAERRTHRESRPARAAHPSPAQMARTVFAVLACATAVAAFSAPRAGATAPARGAARAEDTAPAKSPSSTLHRTGRSSTTRARGQLSEKRKQVRCGVRHLAEETVGDRKR